MPTAKCIGPAVTRARGSPLEMRGHMAMEAYAIGMAHIWPHIIYTISFVRLPCLGAVTLVGTRVVLSVYACLASFVQHPTQEFWYNRRRIF